MLIEDGNLLQHASVLVVVDQGVLDESNEPVNRVSASQARLVYREGKAMTWVGSRRRRNEVYREGGDCGWPVTQPLSHLKC